MRLFPLRVDSNTIICCGAIIIIALTSTILIAHGQKELFARGILILGLPIILAAIIYIHAVNKRYNKTLINNLNPAFFDIHVSMWSGNIQLKHIFMLNILLLIISIAVLMSPIGRSTIYFLVLSFSFVLILIGILSFDNNNANKKFIVYTILFLLIIFYLNVALGYNIPNNPVIFTTDIFIHKSLIESILETGHITSRMGDYRNHPMFHILNAIGMETIGVSNFNMSYNIFNNVLFSMSIFFVYVLSKNIVNSTKLSLLSASFYTLMQPVVLEGMGTITRTSAFVLCLFILSIITYRSIINNTNRINDTRFRIILVLATFSLVLWHTTTLLMFSIFLVLLYCFSYLQPRTSGSIRIDFNYILFIVTTYIAYWGYVCNASFERWINQLVSTQEVFIIDQSPPPFSLLVSLIINIDYIFVYFFSFLGILLINKYKNILFNFGSNFVLITALSLPFYNPTFAFIVGSAILGHRLPLLVSPFVSIVFSIGFIFIISEYVKNIRKRIILLFIFIFIFSAQILFIIGSNTDSETPLNSLVDGYPKQNYLRTEELLAYNFNKKYGSKDAHITTDYVYNRYLQSISYRFDLSSNYLDIIGDKSIPRTCYIIFRDHASRSGRGLSFSKSDTSERGGGFTGRLLYIMRINNVDQILELTERYNIYENGSTIVSLRKG